MFRSPIAKDLEEFLQFKRRRGYKYVRAEYTLRCFDRFVSKCVREQGRSFRLDQTPLAWLATRSIRKPISTAPELATLRRFWEHMRSRHPRRYPRDITWPQLSVKRVFVPHILNQNEIRGLLRMIDAVEPVYVRSLRRTAFLVLYCTGLRFGELARLRMQDVDLQRQVIFVSESKGRARWVPFHPSLGKELSAYMRKRRLEDDRPSRPDDHFFIRSKDRGLSVSWISGMLRDLLRQAGLKPVHGRAGPRPYDLRHAFAVHRLTRWYRQGIDLHARLAWLSAYMGHVNMVGTETYLTATPELLALAAHRFRQRFQDKRRFK